MLKKLSGFANTAGGLLVVGAYASSQDGRVTGLPGVDPQAGYKQTVVQWCFEGIAPPLDVEVSDPIPLTDSPGRVCYVVRVAESDLGPHFLNGRKGVYVRTDEFSARFEAHPANENELRQLLNRRELVRRRRDDLVRRARQRFDVFAEQKYSELGRRQSGIGARFDLSIGPRFPGRMVCDLAALLSFIQANAIPWRDVGFPRTTGGGVVSQHESVVVLRPGPVFPYSKLRFGVHCFTRAKLSLTSRMMSRVFTSTTSLGSFWSSLNMLDNYSRMCVTRERYNS